jgi:hypothetical protein
MGGGNWRVGWTDSKKNFNNFARAGQSRTNKKELTEEHGLARAPLEIRGRAQLMAEFLRRSILNEIAADAEVCGSTGCARQISGDGGSLRNPVG